MLKVNPAHAHANNSPSGVQRSMVANAASNASLHSDPAGFASLLKQNQAKAPAPSHAPAPPPAPKPAAPPAPQAAKAPAPADDSSPSKADSGASADAAQANATHSTESTDSSNTAARGKAMQRTRQANDANSTAAQRAAQRTTGKDTGPDSTNAAATAANDAKKDVSGQANPADTPIDPAIMQWLAGQQRGIPTSTDARAAKADLDSKTAADDKGEALGAAAGKSAKVELRADAKDGAVTVDKALQGKSLGDTLGADAGFAAMLAGKRAADVHDTAPGSTVDAKDASAAIGAASFAPEHRASAVADTPVAVAVPTPVDSPEFPKALGLHMSVLAKDGVTQAELHLNPADMGPVSVQIVMDGTQARVDFGADVAATRHAIEAGLPELASALRDAGFTLAGGGVSDSSRGPAGGGGSFGGEARSGGRQARAVDAATTAKVSAAARRVVTKGGVDLFV
jgi:flagellar hook-length control protein FliK